MIARIRRNLLVLLAITVAALCTTTITTSAGEPVARVSGSPYFLEASETEAGQRLRASFVMMDENRDGYISGIEIPRAMSGFRDDREPLQHGEAAWLEGIDLNSDRRADWNEFSNYFSAVLSFNRCLTSRSNP
jgi:hypothetical protein